MKKRKRALRRLCVCALFASLLCVLSPFAIPIGAVPVSLSLLVILLCAVMLGEWGSLVSVFVYLVLGVLGLPVFSGGMGGVGVLVGPTGGYIWSYLLICLICGFLYRRVLWKSEGSAKIKFLQCIAIGAIGILLCYTCGTLQYMLVANVPLGGALAVCVLPFIAFDIAKIVAIAFLGERICKIASLRHAVGELFF